MAKTDSTQRYDRQLRLWKAHGQARLEASHILLLGATAAGTELLKNLVLPGIGEVTIVDDQPVTGSDVGNNFFVQSTGTTDRRCDVVAANLRELNEDVHIHAVFEDPERYIQRNLDTLSRFSLISTSLPRATLHSTLSTACWQQSIPLVAITLAGFVGYLRIQVREHTVIESHADAKDDLRLDRPFPALERLAATFDLDCADSMEHGHIPYAIILLKFYQCWRTENPDKARMSFADKKAVRYAITQAMRNSDEENFEEAEKNALRALNPTEIPSVIQALFDCSACQNLTSQSPDFWIIVRALRDFVQQEGEGQLPVSGGVPDMKTDTVSYVKLQSTYFDKSEEDYQATRGHVQRLLGDLGLAPDHIADDTLRLACKHSAQLQVQEGSIYRQDPTHCLQYLANDGEITGNLLWYAAFLEIVHQTADKAVNSTDDPTDAITLQQELRKRLEDTVSAEAYSKRLDYVTRLRGTEIHNMAALIGGMAAQEIVKLLTHQYVPLDNLCVFNGMDSTSSSFKL